jgi:hypothetical protein
MTVGEKARLASAVEHAGRIIDQLPPDGATPFLKDMEALRDKLNEVPEKSGTGAQELGEQLGSAVSGLLGENSAVNVYVTVNGGASGYAGYAQRTPSFMQSGRHG